MIAVGTALDLRAPASSAGGRVITLFVNGELGRVELAQVCDELFRLAHRGCFSVVLDLTEVSHIDYRGVRPLVMRAELFRKAGGDIMLTGVSRYLKAILRAAGAHESLKTFETVEEAKAAFAA